MSTQPTIFTRIVNGEIPCHKIAETENYLAFLDIMPLREGHVLVIPKQPTDYIFDLEEEAYVGLWLFAKYVADGVRKAVPCRKVGIAVVGLEVPHAHIHLIPIDSVADMDFSREKLKPAQEALAATAAAIRAQLG